MWTVPDAVKKSIALRGMCLNMAHQKPHAKRAYVYMPKPPEFCVYDNDEAHWDEIKRGDE
jgi:hypothetical protein